MTSGRAPDGPSRGADAPTRTSGTRDGIGAILAILALGLVFRLIIAQLNPGLRLPGRSRLVPGLGREPRRASGLHGFYDRPFFHDYTPGYLYVLYAGRARRAGGRRPRRPDQDPADPRRRRDRLARLVDGPGARRRAGGRPSSARRSSSPTRSPGSTRCLWGQVDSFGVVFLLLGLRALWRDQPERAAIWTVIAALIKPQLAILVPIVAVVTIRRALWPTGSPSTDDARPTTCRDRSRAGGSSTGSGRWERRTDHPIRILTTGLAGLLTAVVLCFPFGLSVIEPGPNGRSFHSGLIEQIFKTAGGYPYASVNAYNPWALAALGGNGVAENSGWACDTVILNAAPGGAACPRRVMIAGIPAVYVGAALLVAAFVLVGDRRRPPARPADDPHRAGGPRGRLLHPADPRPRALPLPVRRARGDPRARSRGAGGSPTSSCRRRRS